MVLGQLLTGIAFMSKVQEQRLVEKGAPEAAEASKIVRLVNEAIHKARELSRGLMPGLAEPNGLMSSSGADGARNSGSVRSFLPILFERAAADPRRHSRRAISITSRRKRLVTRSSMARPSTSKSICAAPRFRCPGYRTPDCAGHRWRNRARAPEHSGMGLDIMKHRATMIGGALAIASNSKVPL